MKVITAPKLAPDGAPLVALRIGDSAVDLSPNQAEDISTSLFRAASAARHESAMREALSDASGGAQAAVERVRASMEARRRCKN